jgi:hypothetical protein
MSDLAAFLLARIAEIEDVVRAGPQYMLRPDEFAAEVPVSWKGIYGDDLHVYPLLLLADCDAKRRIVDDYRWYTEPDEYGPPRWSDNSPADQEYELAGGRFVGLRTAVRLLALPYADHPGYREEWRP